MPRNDSIAHVRVNLTKVVVIADCCIVGTFNSHLVFTFTDTYVYRYEK